MLTEFDLRLEPGRKVALVGPSGAGKTTVVNLLLRFLDPAAGGSRSTAATCASTAQEDVRGTFARRRPGRASLRLDHPREPAARAPRRVGRELTAVLARARLADWVATLPDGLDTLVGEEGMRLSGGQRQRLVLARALLADAPVLVLDEPTAHLDPETAERLMDDMLDASATAPCS